MASAPTQTLAARFPMLPFAPEADRFLTAVPRMKLLEQLRARHVGAVECIPKWFPAGLSIMDDGRFLLSFNDVNTPEQDAESLGHELGHTFHYDLSARPPRPLLPPPEEISDELFDLVEQFCDAFSEAWLARVDKELIMKAAENQREGILRRSYILEEE